MKEACYGRFLNFHHKERIRLAKVILDSVSDDDGAELSESQKAFIDERLAYEKANPNATIKWEQIKAGLKPRSTSKR
jgi:putative addiction module component (TIGR02574 family)